jgi:hypothetical protein
VRCLGFRGDDLMRCILTKVGSEEMSEFHDLQTHLSCIRNFMSCNDRTSAMRSSGRINDDGTFALRGELDRRLVIETATL